MILVDKWHEVNMTATNAPAPYKTGWSSVQGSAYGWKAFKELVYLTNPPAVDYDYWSVGTNYRTGALSLDFGSKTKVNKVKIRSCGNEQSDYLNPPTKFTIQGSDDGSTWDTLLTVTDVSPTWTYNEDKVFTFDKEGEYSVYRINVTECIRISTGSTTSGTLAVRRMTFGYYGEAEINHVLVFNDNAFKKWNTSTSSWEIINNSTTLIEQNYVEGNTAKELSNITEDEWGLLSGEIELYTFNNLGGDILYATQTVDSFSVYDHISENPQAIIYTESTDDITVSTTTEPYDLYDEFGDEVEVLYYTDDEAVTEADLILEANWSPIDELEGDFEVVTWTDEPQETAQRVLEMTAIPKPQFIKLANPKRLYGYLESILTSDSSTTYRFDKSTRYLLSNNSKDWYVWDKYSQLFVKADASTHELIRKNGMTDEDINSITDEQWKTWKGDYLNIGIFLEDNPRDTIVSVVDSVSYSDYLPRHSTQVEKGSFYILNTTAKIDLEINGAFLKGILSDDDLTRVQYRVFVNNKVHFPSDGSFTQLGESPTNIELVIPSKEIIIGDWNTVKVEFQDFYGATDYWQTQFIGTYSGLMFKDIHGDYYSSEIGEVLKYLDFGVIIAGQTTIEHEILLKNQYGYDVENIYLYANTSDFPQGMKIEFSESLSPFLPQPELRLAKALKNNEEYSFFVRLKTELGSTPNANGSFDIIVRADKVV